MLEQLIDKAAYLLLPSNFNQIFGYCVWYWILLSLIFIWVLRKK